MRPHIATAHALWKKMLRPGDVAIDATCGNGHDSALIASLILPLGELHCIDIQKEAIENTKALVPNAIFHHASHVTLPTLSKPPRLIVYNLGYLPKGDHSLTTQADSTVQSLRHATDIAEGMVCMTCYSGHPGGKEEEEAALGFARSLPSSYTVSHFRWVDKPCLPSLLVIYGQNHHLLLR